MNWLLSSKRRADDRPPPAGGTIAADPRGQPQSATSSGAGTAMRGVSRQVAELWFDADVADANADADVKMDADFGAPVSWLTQRQSLDSVTRLSGQTSVSCRAAPRGQAAPLILTPTQTQHDGDAKPRKATSGGMDAAAILEDLATEEKSGLFRELKGHTKRVVTDYLISMGLKRVPFVNTKLFAPPGYDLRVWTGPPGDKTEHSVLLASKYTRLLCEGHRAFVEIDPADLVGSVTVGKNDMLAESHKWRSVYWSSGTVRLVFYNSNPNFAPSATPAPAPACLILDPKDLVSGEQKKTDCVLPDDAPDEHPFHDEYPAVVDTAEHDDDCDRDCDIADADGLRLFDHKQPGTDHEARQSMSEQIPLSDTDSDDSSSSSSDDDCDGQQVMGESYSRREFVFVQHDKRRTAVQRNLPSIEQLIGITASTQTPAAALLAAEAEVVAIPDAHDPPQAAGNLPHVATDGSELVTQSVLGALGLGLGLEAQPVLGAEPNGKQESRQNPDKKAPTAQVQVQQAAPAGADAKIKVFKQVSIGTWMTKKPPEPKKGARNPTSASTFRSISGIQPAPRSAASSSSSSTQDVLTAGAAPAQKEEIKLKRICADFAANMFYAVVDDVHVN